MSGEEITSSDAEKYCDPIIYNKDLHERQYSNHIGIDNKPIPIKDIEKFKSEIASPCGLIAKSYFNDTYSMNLNDKNIKIEENGISWPNDRGKKYKS